MGANQSQRQPRHRGIEDGYPEERQEDREKQWHTHIESEAKVGTEKDRERKSETEEGTASETQRGAKAERPKPEMEDWDRPERLAKTESRSGKGGKVRSWGRGRAGGGEPVTTPAPDQQ